MKYLVTGAAGFIGSFVAGRLCQAGHDVVGIDNLNDYYDPALKQTRLDTITSQTQFRFIRLSLEDRPGIEKLFADEDFDRVIHLAAQAGVRYSIENPHTYIDSNIVGFLHILEGCRHHSVEHLVYASSSSVYGMNAKIPFSTTDNVDHPVSLYAATKKSNELMAHTYSHLYSIPTTGLRFFTVYGPWGRPDMAPILFVDAIAKGDTIKVFNHGDMQRDFTYIDDIVEGVMRVQDKIPGPDDVSTDSSASPYYRLFNIGNNQPVTLEDFISTIENALEKKAVKEYLPMQPGDVKRTYADTVDLEAYIAYKPSTPLKTGIDALVKWRKEYLSL
ncbi:MAG: protein CapI [Gammaproteobacteria bacterium]|nr:protein CapI [Gammaproteobacteria bacterium]